MMIAWILAGILLLILEMLSGSFVLLFVSLGCFGAALTAALETTPSITLETVVFLLTSIIGVTLLRKPLQRRMLRSIQISVDMGKEILAQSEIAPHQTSRIAYQGSQWQATNLDNVAIRTGDRAVIVGIDGNTLLIRKVD